VLTPVHAPDAAAIVRPPRGPSPYRLRTRRRRRLRVGTALALTALLALAVGRALWPSGDDRGPGNRTGQAAAGPGHETQLADWLTDNTARGATVLVPAALRPVLRRAAPTLALRTYTGTPRGAADLVVVDSRASRPRVPAAPTGDLVARFGSGGWEVRAVAGGWGGPAVRRQAGRQLVADVRLRLTPRAWSTLVAGTVDPRVLGLLAGVVAGHTLDVAGFPRAAAERAAAAPARSVRITALDGALVQDGAGPAVRAVLGALALPSAPDEVRQAPGGEALVARFLLPAPAGSVPEPGGST
jgi:hypothetical protein